MILVIDNYDSFTYNLVQAFEMLGQKAVVRRNDRIAVEEAEALSPDALVVSPGPGTPRDAGRSTELIRHFASSLPVLGVCLGHQCVAAAYGAEVVRAERLMHGKVSRIYHDSRTIYRGLTNPFEATRYHSLIVPEESLPPELGISAHTSEGEIMGLRVAGTRVEGTQFHPESILSAEGPALLANFVALIEPRVEAGRSGP